MKIVTAEQFMKLPKDTFFAEHQGNNEFGGFFIKDETIAFDGRNRGYWAAPFTDPYAEDSDDLFRKMEQMKDDNLTFPLDLSYSKALPVDANEFFLVYEPEDLLKIRSLIDQALSATNTEKPI